MKSEFPTSKVKIIKDSPSDEDFFSGKGHKRSAHALSETIVQLSDSGGAVGLEGPWGAGKSSVIKMAENSLANERNIAKVFTFDLWSHYTEDFRRSFLESLVSWMQQEKVEGFSDSLADDARGRIRDKVKTIVYEKESSYSWAGAFFIAVVPLIPLAYMWLSPFAFSEDPIAPKSKYTEYAECFVYVIYGVLASSVFINFLSKRKEGVLKAISKSVNVFSKEVDKEVLDQYIRDKDPTSAEFYDLFAWLVGCSKNTQIVLVFDNIDRLPMEKIPEVWSEVRSIFTVCEPGKEPVNVVAVVPYDKKLIMDAFKSALQNSECIVEEDIFNKTFDRTIKVSPPLATDWKQYLSFNVANALEEEVPSDVLDRLFRLLQRKIQEDSVLPTPRVVISYVNEIGSLYTQWGSNIPIETMALYVLHRSEVDNDPLFLEKSSCISERFLHVANDSEWRKNLAALIFNVEPKDANEVLLTDPVNGALVKDEDSEIKDLSEVKGFDEILANVVHENSKSWAEEGDLVLSNVARNLSAIDLSRSLELDVWLQLEKTLRTVQFGPLERLDKLKGLLEIVQASKHPFNASLILFLALRRSVIDKENLGVHHGVLWSSFVFSVIKKACKCSRSELKDFPINKVEIPRGESFAIGVAICCEQDQYFAFDDLKLVHNKDEIHKQLSGLIDEDAASYLSAYNQLRESVLSESNINEDYKKLINRLNSEDVEGLADVIEAVRQLSDDSKDFSALESYFSNGKIYIHIEKLSDLEDDKSLASLIWIVLNKNSAPTLSVAPNPNVQNSVPGAKSGWDHTARIFEGKCPDSAIKRLSEFARDNGFFNKIAGYAIKNGSGLYKIVLKYMLLTTGIGRVNALYLVYNYKSIIAACGKEVSSDVIRDIGERFSDRLDIDFSKVPSAFVIDLYPCINNKKLAVLYGKIARHLQDLSVAEFSEALYEEGNDLDLLIAVKKVDSSFKLSAGIYRPVIVDHACDIIRGEQKLPTRSGDWEYVVSCIKNRSYRAIGQDIIDKAGVHYLEKDGVESFFTIYSDITYEMPLEEYPDLSLNRIYSNLCAIANDEWAELYEKHLGKVKKCLESCEKGTKEDFIEIVNKHENSFCRVVREGLDLQEQSGS